jgi:hypothetical protein
LLQGSRRRWTKPGLAFFIAASVVANGYYYGWWHSLFDWLMPVFATLALPMALALFAEEFGAEVKREQRQAKRDERQPERITTEPGQAETQPEPAETPTERAATEPERTEPQAERTESEPLPFACSYPGCGRSFATQPALAGHTKAHRNGNGRKEPIPERMVHDVR